jgi:hypothetical protein
VKATIRLEQLLREAVVTAYNNLVTRPTGRAVRSSIEGRLSTGEYAIATLDFTNIELVDLSCADEVVARLVKDPPAGTYMVLHGLDEHQLEGIAHVLEHQGLAAVARDPATGHLRPIGAVSADEVHAFGVLVVVGRLHPEALATHAAWEAERARRALVALAGRRLIRAEADTYSIPFDL